MPKKLILLTVLLAVLFLSWTAFRRSDGELASIEAERPREPAVKVVATPVIITANDRNFEAVGTGRALRSIDVYPAVSEEVKALEFSAGQVVKAGQLLVQLDDEAERLAIELAKVELEEAKSLLVRYDRAVKDGGVPQSEVDSARTAVDAAEVRLKQARIALEERAVTAAFEGIVGIPRVDPGDRVTSETRITGLDDRSSILVDFSLPEALVGALVEGQQIRAKTPAFPGKVFHGEISSIESRVDSAARTILTRASIDNAEDLLRPGMSFALSLQITGAEFPSIPEIALQWGHDGAYVWAVRDGGADKVPVNVVSRTAGKVLIEGDVRKGEMVVVEGLQRLTPGRRVETAGVFRSGSFESEKPTASAGEGSQ